MTHRYLLPIGETLRAAWAKTSGSKTTVWKGILVSALISMLLALTLSATKSIPALNVPINLIAVVIQNLLQAGLLYMGLRWVYGLPIALQHLFKGFEKQTALHLIGLYLLQILVMLPFILCLIVGGGLAALSDKAPYQHINSLPVLAITLNVFAIIGIIWLTLRLFLAVGFILDQQSSPWLAIKQSFWATEGNTLRLAAIILAMIAIILVSAIPLGIGLIWTLPFSIVLFGILYQNLKAATQTV